MEKRSLAAGLSAPTAKTPVFSTGQGFQPAEAARKGSDCASIFGCVPWSEYVEIYWGSHGQAYRPKFHSFREGLNEFPELAARLNDTDSSTRAMGALSISRQLKHVCRANVALIGEASGSVDAITGEGMALAFRQALALAPVLVAGDLSSYATAHSKINSLPEFMSRSMLLMDRSRWLRQRSLQALSRQPSLFARMLAVHVGEMRLKDFGASGLLNLGWQLLRA
jgi:menaquinone-9 beta-reductase